MPRAFLIVLDSVGCGGARDAALYDDVGADTLGNIARAVGGLALPHMDALGLGLACAASALRTPSGLGDRARADAFYGCAMPQARGKDTPTGHWEIAGAPNLAGFGLLPRQIPAMPEEMRARLLAAGNLSALLCDRHIDGLAAIQQYGAAHLQTGAPIVYTSVDSVLQIAAHESAFGLQRLFDLCAAAREIADDWKIGRVIARPFEGAAGNFTRTPRRRDFAMSPPQGNLLDRAQEAGRAIISIGKIGDIFRHRATGEEIKIASDSEGVDALVGAARAAPDGALVFANLVQCDSDFGHRRDAPGYARQLAAFDARLGEIEAGLRDGDLLAITADHGNDPTFKGTDHTRENAPVIGMIKGGAGRAIGRRESFADIGQSIAAHLRLAPTKAGVSFL